MVFERKLLPFIECCSKCRLLGLFNSNWKVTVFVRRFSLKNLVVCVSKYYANTLKIAQTIASTLEAEVKKPAEISDVSEYSLIGFGSGIYFGKHDPSLLEFVDRLPKTDKKAFIFSTRGRNGLFEKTYHKALREKLNQKGYSIMGEFSCRGFSDYYKIFKLFGGVNKGHPNKEDIEKATAFGRQLLKISTKS